MLARSPDVAYPKRLVWVDQATRIPVRQELYAVSGMLLKTWLMEAPKQFDSRWYPTRMVLKTSFKKARAPSWSFVTSSLERASTSRL